ncbi:MAG: Soluble ligand binding domain protein, partial [Actinomycetia bacterium]|jgi:competence protein ComEA|nr:Soluble ligand binding domain protein [Actinomycetes bacterium]
MSFRERLDTLSRGEIAGLIVVFVAVLGGAGLWYARSLPKPVTIARAAPGGASLGSPSSSPVVTIIVDVAGEVERPGVYEFAEGDRVIDAIERAGGQLPKADLSLLNLAAPLTDGTQILVPRAGPPSVVVPGGTAGSSGGLININSASATELETLSGIGEVLAATIVEYREQNGPFASVDDLMDVSGIGPATLEEIRDQVTV